MNNRTNETPQWYVRKGSRVQGPYSVLDIRRFLKEGRIRFDKHHTDEVSIDGKVWEPVTQVPELVDESLLPSMDQITKLAWLCVDMSGSEANG